MLPFFFKQCIKSPSDVPLLQIIWERGVPISKFRVKWRKLKGVFGKVGAGVNPSIADATFIQSTKMQGILKNI